jgi:hypothetical protein
MVRRIGLCACILLGRDRRDASFRVSRAALTGGLDDGEALAEGFRLWVHNDERHRARHAVRLTVPDSADGRARDQGRATIRGLGRRPREKLRCRLSRRAGRARIETIDEWQVKYARSCAGQRVVCGRVPVQWRSGSRSTRYPETLRSRL